MSVSFKKLIRLIETGPLPSSTRASFQIVPSPWHQVSTTVGYNSTACPNDEHLAPLEGQSATKLGEIVQKPDVLMINFEVQKERHLQ